MLHIKDIDGKKHSIELDKDSYESIVDIAENKGIELPYSCRSGACFSCCAQVKKGEEFPDSQKTGEQLIDTEEGEVLTCICGIKKDVFTDVEDREIEIEMLN